MALMPSRASDEAVALSGEHDQYDILENHTGDVPVVYFAIRLPLCDLICSKGASTFCYVLIQDVFW